MLNNIVYILTRKRESAFLKGVSEDVAKEIAQLTLVSYLQRLQVQARNSNAQSREIINGPTDNVVRDVDFVAFTGTDNWVPGSQGQYCTRVTRDTWPA